MPAGGYSWWYIDALSDDKTQGLTIIAFVGSVFSPYYAWSGWREPENHCALNVALYGPTRNLWAMTERGRGSLKREADAISIGPSAMHWKGDALHVEINEWTAPIPTRLRGAVTLHPQALAQETFALDADHRHHWRPIAPSARIEVRLDEPNVRWNGRAYFDSNWGEEPLENAFRAWDWSRAHTNDGAIVYYDLAPRHGADRTLALRFGRDGGAHAIQAPPRTPLPGTFWGLQRATRGRPGEAPRLVRTLEDAPFYARSALAGEIDGSPADIVHESLWLERFANPLVRAMLPFRMPRLVGRR
ncbi:MAG: carotenoid 1,2-hydratase [Phycisphaerales bacterium]|nr:carotenoid 1,2-hydratase [Hyphomonadaceae bacterium]